MSVPAEIIESFLGESDIYSVAPLGSGLIHGTLLVSCSKGAFVFQCFNEDVFNSPDAVMSNISKVQGLTAQTSEPTLSFLTLRGSQELLCRDRQVGNLWRCSAFIPDTITFDVPPGEEYLKAAARAFADFACRLKGLNNQDFFIPIPNFHNTEHRYQVFQESWTAAQPERRSESDRASLENLISTAFPEFGLTGLSPDQVPHGIVHNDTKLNNCLFYRDRPEVCCVVDLDTVMPGSWLMDFGDLCRSSVCLEPEDSTNLEGIAIDQHRFASVVEGYLEVFGEQASPDELKRMVYAAYLMTLELALRFFTDHLQNDRYFTISRPGHNLDRVRCQTRLAQAFAHSRTELEAIVERSLHKKRSVPA